MKTNQFSHWKTQEILEWVGAFRTYSLLTIHNANTYIDALKELNKRKGDNVVI
ncbi:MAG TPA: hypothetical protein VFC79_08035 [Tissierellaceae bacterium]|nr:hypothetical protein [Tissierellaceae bacterium]